MSEAMMTITMASFGLVALGISLLAGLKGWQGWLEVKRMELAGPTRREPRSPTAGCCDRTYWAWKFVDFPGARFQEALCVLSFPPPPAGQRDFEARARMWLPWA